MTAATSFAASDGHTIVEAMVEAIDKNAAMLSEIDGAIGDGDHGINMRKGFLLVRDALPADVSLSDGLELVADTLMTRIGGAMGPLYGTLFAEMSDTCRSIDQVDAVVFGRMLGAGRRAVEDIGGASVGDKTLLDTLVPAEQAFLETTAAGVDFTGALAAMMDAAERGKESTRDLVAKVGRASRLGERSWGALDAGATSCWILLDAMAGAMTKQLAAQS